MKRSFSLVLILLLSALLLSLVSAQTILWEHTWGGASDDTAYDTAIDRFGSSYMVGYTDSFGAGYGDAFIAKFGSGGSLIWDRTWGGADAEVALGVALDNGGDAYVAGDTGGFGAGGDDAFIAAFDGAGNLLWDLTWGGTGYDLASDIALDRDGNIYMVGVTSSFGAGDTDVFVAKFDSRGSLVWDRTWGGTLSDEHPNLAVDKSGNIYIMGTTSSFGTGAGDIFIAKFSPDGSLIWDLTWGTSAAEYTWEVYSGLVVDDEGNLYVTGTTTAYGATRGYDVFVAKFDSDGNLIWDLVWGGTGEDWGRAIGLDEFGNIYVVGETESFGPSTDGFLLKLDPTGKLLSQMAWGGDDYDALFSVAVRGSKLSAVGEADSPTRSIKTISGSILDVSATIADPPATITDPDATITDPDATVIDPDATLDTVVGEEAAILQFRVPVPVGGEVITPYSQRGWEQITSIMAIVSLISILTITVIIRRRYMKR